MMKMKRINRLATAILLMTAVASCAKYEDNLSFMKDAAISSPEGDGNGGSHAGILTAGEWNDLSNWEFWGKLLKREDVDKAHETWGFHTDYRIAIKVTDTDGNPVAGSQIEATMGRKTVWTSVTDNHGTANCWINLFDGKEPEDADIIIKVDGKEQKGSPVFSFAQDGEAKYNEYKVEKAPSVENSVDIAFIVDATGSMGDEIDFLKDDLEDIIGKAASPAVAIRTGAVFYRDEEDDYVTRTSAFTEDLSKTRKFIKAQEAEGGGDYPEAVHTALEASLQELAWNSKAKSRIAFLILDAPAHDKVKVKESLHKSIQAYSDNGIILIPVAASGADLSTEMMLRFFAVATNGTYTFLTNDSGVGNEHLEPSIGEYEVENLNELMTRLIQYYME